MESKLTPGLIAAASDMELALRAHAAWAWSEKHGLVTATFDERMDLCAYANWLTEKALAKIQGKTWEEAYSGVPHMHIWPSIYISRAEQDETQAVVDRIIAEWETAIAKFEAQP